MLGQRYLWVGGTGCWGRGDVGQWTGYWGRDDLGSVGQGAGVETSKGQWTDRFLASVCL